MPRSYEKPIPLANMGPQRYDVVMANPTREQMAGLLRYEPDTGDFYWKIRRGWVPAGAKAGYRDPYGYVKINVCGWPRRAHRIAWLMATGEWPPDGTDIDHVNRNRSDNRWSNLRLASRSQNMGNSPAHRDGSSGVKGLTWLSRRQKWQVRICVQGKRKTLGYFASKEQAALVYRRAAQAAFGEFARDAPTEGRRRGNLERGKSSL
jgi:hypothetical protein